MTFYLKQEIQADVTACTAAHEDIGYDLNDDIPYSFGYSTPHSGLNFGLMAVRLK